MGNCLFCYPDQLLGSASTTTTLSGGSWQGSLPLANLKNRLTTKVARSTDALAASTQFDVDLGAARNLRLLALLHSNLTIAASVRFRICADAGYAQLLYDTGVIPVPWRDLAAETLEGWRPDLWLALPDDITARYVRVTILDQANPAGYVELGRCLMMPAWQPAVNLGYGNPIHYDHSATTMEQSLGGVRFAGRRRPQRVQALELPYLEAGEAHQSVLEMQRRLGRDGELFFVRDPDEEDVFARQKSFLATMEDLSPLESPYFNNYATSFQLREVM